MGTHFTETELASLRQRHDMVMHAQLKNIFSLGTGTKAKPGKSPVRNTIDCHLVTEEDGITSWMNSRFLL